ncbi:MAG: D-hexose-6-phosphate mutarotase [Kiritimatiellae bacterium]|nr:D-hexose-6-phosphate mutarotase [Kiritimatiellia bacterium]
MITELLNKGFGIPHTLTFITELDGMTYVYITNNSATAKISLYGAQVLSFRPRHQEDILWVSSKSLYKQNKAIRGGIPLCWPWFGAHPTDSTKQSHGFARLSEWSVLTTEAVDEETTRIILKLQSSDETMKMWPHKFITTLTVTISNKLTVELTTNNSGNEPFTITSALHSYFNISDISKVAIHGLENSTFLDSLTNKEQTENEPIKINQEVDRIYLDHTGNCEIKDTGLERTIQIDKQGSSSTVVWNPWIDKAKRMADFGDDEYQTMLCVETTNAHTDTIEITPDKAHTLTAVISLVEQKQRPKLDHTK